MTILKGTTQTKGHLESNGGLRGHSVGGAFPVIVSMVGLLDNLHYLVQAPDGAKATVLGREEAESMATAWLEVRKHTQGAAASHFVLSKVKNVSTESPDVETDCIPVGDEVADFDFYSIYAYDLEGIAGCVWDSKGNVVSDYLEAWRVMGFLNSREYTNQPRKVTK